MSFLVYEFISYCFLELKNSRTQKLINLPAYL